MLSAGNYHTLTIARISPHGLYLTNDEGDEVLLPNRYVSLSDVVGDTKEVFIYHDSENRLIATTEHPFVKVGEIAALEVVDTNHHGAFLDWGITAKDLFIPNSNQGVRMERGRRYVVAVYRDNVSGRVVATTKLNGAINNDGELSVKHHDKVDILVAQRIGTGFRVIVNNRHWGVIYDNQLFQKVRIGDRLTGFVQRITPDNRIDINLQQEGLNGVKESTQKLLELARQNGGVLPLNDDSSPEDISSQLNMSKKVFKRALGYLLSHNQAEIVGGEIRVK